MIRLINLSKNYGALSAVDSLNLEVPGGQIFGFLGPNGAGKTTTIRMIMGILKPTSGQVFLGDYDMAREPESAKAIAGFIPDRPFIYEKLSGYEFLQFVGKLHRMEPPRLAQNIAEICLEEPRVQRVTVSVDKPGALRFARSVAVEITRDA